MPIIDTLLLAAIPKAQLFLLGGFIMLGWVLARRQVKMRKRVNRDARVANRELKKIRNHKEIAVPLCDAPPETQRWQAALFDLQRELKAELDTRIAVVQSLVRQADQRIARLEALERSWNVRSEMTGGKEELVAGLLREGHTASEIATKTGLPIGDIELTIATFSQV
jgi:hypothetical protein